MHRAEDLATVTKLWTENYSKRSTLTLEPYFWNFLNCTETANARRLKPCVTFQNNDVGTFL